MIFSLRRKIFAMVLGIMVLVAAPIMLFSRWSVEDAMLDSEENAARNIVQLVELNVSGRYKNLLLEKLDMVKTSRERLKRLASMVVSGLDQFREMVAQGLLSEEQAQQLALNWMARLEFETDAFCFVFDSQDRVLSYPDPSWLGKDISGFRDFKDRSVTRAAREDAHSSGSAFLTFRWKSLSDESLVKRFGYFVIYQPWQWVIGATADMQLVERRLQQTMDEIIQVFQATFPEIKVAKTGYITLFTSQREVLVKPDHQDIDLERALDLKSGRLLLDSLMEAAASPLQQPLLVEVAGPDGKPEPRESYVAYFKAMDCYIATLASPDEIREPARRLMRTQAEIFFVVLVPGLLVSLWLASRVSRPLQRLTVYATQLSSQDFTTPQSDSLEMDKLPVRSKDEVGNLAKAFVFMEKSLRENIRNLMDLTAAKQRIQSELSIAREIQLGLLPKIFPPFPCHKEFDLYAMLQSAREVGGDLYDFYLLDEKHLCFTIGDVSDKGVPAALFMTIAKTLVKVAAERDRDPAGMMRLVNSALSRDNPNTMFVTLVIGVLNLETGRLNFANAGHNQAILISRDGVGFLEGLSGPMVGPFEGVDYTPLEAIIKPGDALFLYTDGVTEAMSPDRQLFSDQRLLDVLSGLRTESAEEIIRIVMNSVRKHAAGAEQSDDITMLCIRYLGPCGQDPGTSTSS